MVKDKKKMTGKLSIYQCFSSKITILSKKISLKIYEKVLPEMMKNVQCVKKTLILCCGALNAIATPNLQNIHFYQWNSTESVKGGQIRVEGE